MTRKSTDGFISFFAPHVLDQQRKDELNQIVSNTRALLERYRTEVQAHAARMAALQQRQLKMMFIMGYDLTFKEVLSQLPNLEDFNTKPYEIADLVVKVVVPAIGLLVSMIPGGEVVGMLVTYFTEGIMSAIDIAKIDDAIEDAQNKYRSLLIAIGINEATMRSTDAMINRINNDLSDFEKRFFRALHVSSWDEVMFLADRSTRFNQYVDTLEHVHTVASAKALAAKLHTASESSLFLRLFDLKESLLQKMKQMSNVNLIPSQDDDDDEAEDLQDAPATTKDTTKDRRALSHNEWPELTGHQRGVVDYLRFLSFVFLQRNIQLLRRQTTFLFGAHVGERVVSDHSYLSPYYKQLQEKTRASLKEAETLHARVILSLYQFFTAELWDHAKAIEPVQSGFHESLSIVVPGFLDGVLPFGTDISIVHDTRQSFLESTEKSLKAAMNRHREVTEDFMTISNGFLGVLKEHFQIWCGLGKSDDDALAYLSDLHAINSQDLKKAVEVVDVAVPDRQVQDEVFALLGLRSAFEKSRSRIED